MFDFQTFNRL